MFIQSGAWVITSRDRTMEKKWLKKIINLSISGSITSLAANKKNSRPIST